jgi:guanine deaminase
MNEAKTDMDQYMKIAIEEAEKGIHNGEGGPFGAVIVKDGAIIGRGHNQVVKNNDPTCHGEMMAIRDACKKLGTFDLSGSVIYTTGEPCPMCLGAILWANIGKVYYGCNVLDTEKIGFRDEKFYEMSKPEKKKEFVKELGREECLKLYDDYLSISTRKNY